MNGDDAALDPIEDRNEVVAPRTLLTTEHIALRINLTDLALYTLWLYIIYNIPYFLAILAISDHETHHWDAIAPTLKEIGGREHEL